MEIAEMKNYEQAKMICKNHGIKGFRKLKLVRPVYVAGKQCSKIDRYIAERLLNRLVQEGFDVADYGTCLQLAEKGMLDTISIS